MNIINSKLLINMLIKHKLIMPFYRMLPLCLHTRVCVCYHPTHSQENIFNLGLLFCQLNPRGPAKQIEQQE